MLYLSVIHIGLICEQDSVYSLLPLVPEAIQYHPRLYISALLGFVVLALSLSNTLAAKPVIYSSGLSLVSYVAWLIAVSHAYATGMLQPSADLPQRGILWNEYSCVPPIIYNSDV